MRADGGPKLDPTKVTFELVYTPLDTNTPNVGSSKSPTIPVIRGGAYLTFTQTHGHNHTQDHPDLNLLGRARHAQPGLPLRESIPKPHGHTASRTKTPWMRPRQ
jgi:hypothetical protein